MVLGLHFAINSVFYDTLGIDRLSLPSTSLSNLNICRNGLCDPYSLNTYINVNYYLHNPKVPEPLLSTIFTCFQSGNLILELANRALERVVSLETDLQHLDARLGVILLLLQCLFVLGLLVCPLFSLLVQLVLYATIASTSWITSSESVNAY